MDQFDSKPMEDEYSDDESDEAREVTMRISPPTEVKKLVIFLSIICQHTKFQGGADLPPSPDIRDRCEESE